MNKKTLFILMLGVVALAGCKSTTVPKAESKPEPLVQKAAPPAPALSQTAVEALKQAKTEVAAARAVKSLWTSAEEALKKAEEASLKADSDAIIKFSKIAIDQAQLGQAQTKYPPLK